MVNSFNFPHYARLCTHNLSTLVDVGVGLVVGHNGRDGDVGRSMTQDSRAHAHASLVAESPLAKESDKPPNNYGDRLKNGS